MWDRAGSEEKQRLGDSKRGNRQKNFPMKMQKHAEQDAITDTELADICRYNPTTLKPPEASSKRVMWRHHNGRIRGHAWENSPYIFFYLFLPRLAHTYIHVY
jgi:hypothetical protein